MVPRNILIPDSIRVIVTGVRWAKEGSQDAMSSIKLKDEIGSWIVFGGTTTKEDINWIPVTGSTQIVPATGGYYAIESTVNDRGYTFIILPPAPANGTVVGVQVLSNDAGEAHIQASGTDTIDFQVVAILAKSSGQLLERVRYYNGKWLRLDGSYTYTPPPLVGPYLLTTLTTAVAQVAVTIANQAATAAIETKVTIARLEILSYP